MAYTKYKNNVELAFLTWMSQSPLSGHALDEERFFQFVKTVCRYNANKWKSQGYLKKRIISTCPSFSKEKLKELLNQYALLIKFCKTQPLGRGSPLENTQILKSGQYFEKGVKNGKVYMVKKITSTR